VTCGATATQLEETIMKRALVLGTVLAVAWCASVGAAPPAKGKTPSAKAATPASGRPAGIQHAVFTPTDLKWTDGPPSLPKGVKMCVLEGSPEGIGPFTIRFSAPDGYKIPPHWHYGVEHLTVLQGSVFVAMGDLWDESHAEEVPAGGFSIMPPQMHHFVWTKGETIVQIHGMGPWNIVYVNPAEDPRGPQGESAGGGSK
jgi:ChrR-like protein with cupin domain